MNDLVQRGVLAAPVSLDKAEGWVRKKSQPVLGKVSLGGKSGNLRERRRAVSVVSSSTPHPRHVCLELMGSFIIKYKRMKNKRGTFKRISCNMNKLITKLRRFYCEKVLSSKFSIHSILYFLFSLLFVSGWHFFSFPLISSSFIKRGVKFPTKELIINAGEDCCELAAASFIFA